MRNVKSTFVVTVSPWRLSAHRPPWRDLVRHVYTGAHAQAMS